MSHSSSSPHGPISSPTVYALQNRRPSKPKAFTQPGSHSQPKSAATANDQDTHMAQLNPHQTQVGAPPVIRGIQLFCTDELPDMIRSIFPYDLLNAVQSKCFNTAFQTDDNLVLSAPTGSGKTLVMELAIARLMVTSKNPDFKVIYMAPIKALCAERQQDWQHKFGVLGLTCAELTGDTSYDQLRKVQQANIIITTPEKWDSVTRKWRDNAKLVQLIKLFLVDEVHILKDSRGATLEAVVSRMKSIGTPIRFVALSATVPNSEDIATWLGKDSTSSHLPAQREVFDESFRPVKLEKHVYGFRGGLNDFQFDVNLRNQ
jgi:ATP-dependent DNA helicase HFM1/MER3